MALFDIAHTTSYSTLIETMRLHVSCADFEMYLGICRKSPILTHPTCIWRPRRGRPRSNFAEIFGVRKLKPLCGFLSAILRLAVLVAGTPTCGRHRQTDTGP